MFVQRKQAGLFLRIFTGQKIIYFIKAFFFHLNPAILLNKKLITLNYMSVVTIMLALEIVIDCQ